MGNLFLVSVADVIGRNKTTKQIYFYGKANINSQFQTAMQATDVRGGINNPLLFRYYHDREVTVTIDSAIFDKTWLALNAGATTATLSQTTTITKTESVSLTSASGTLSGSALASTYVGVVMSSGSIINVAATGSLITVPGAGTESVTCTYDMSGSGVDYVTGYTITPPAGLELVMTSEVRDNTNTKLYDFQIIIPSFNISGNQQWSLTAAGVSQTKIEGAALVTPGTTSATDYYYIAKFIPA